jgi:YHS domain-containing protein
MQVPDPVCGKLIDLVEAVGSEDHEGWAYFFCSERCRELFMESPARFANQRPEMNAASDRTNRQGRSKCTNESCPH